MAVMNDLINIQSIVHICESIFVKRNKKTVFLSYTTSMIELMESGAAKVGYRDWCTASE